MEPLSRHQKIMLSFSGGKDSLACLYLLRDHWPRIDVVWMNTGDAFPATIALMDRVRAMVPRFVELRSDQPAQIAREGWPVDVVPLTRTRIGRTIDGHDKQLFQSYLACCNANMWTPTSDYVRSSGTTLVIRGTRTADAKKSPVRSGDVVGGVEFWHPIEHWTAEEVFAFLTVNGHEIPAHYRFTKTSLDCRFCTAHLPETGGFMEYVRRDVPEIAPELQRRITEIRDALREELRHVEGCL